MLIQLVHRLVRSRLKRLGIESKWLELNNCRLHYYEYAHPHSKSTLVLVHGLGTSSSTWFHLYPFFIQRHSVLAIDLPGFGFSTIKNGKRFFSIQAHAVLLQEVIQRFGLQLFILMGHSLGGWIATKYASRYPAGVTRLILINTAGVYWDGTEELRKIFDVHSTQDVRRLVNRMWYRYPWYFKPFLPAIRRDLMERRVPELVQAIQREDFLDGDLQRLTMPVCLVWGTEDRLIEKETIQVFEHNVRHVEIEYIETCGHVPQLERPEELERILRKVL